MAATALIQLTQGATVGAAGEALFGASGAAVDVANSVNTGVTSWQIELVDVPPASALTTGIKASSDNSSTPAYSFTPDVAGGYRLVLKVWGGINRTGDPTSTDIRNFGVKGAGGLYRPTQQIWPRPLPPVASGETGNKPDENNFGGQARGWAGGGSDGLLAELIGRADAVTAAGLAMQTAATAAAQAALLQSGLATSPVTVSVVAVGQAVMFMSPVIDAFAAPGTLTTIVPALGASYRVVVTTSRMLVVTRSGTITGGAVGKAGTNAAHNNATPSYTMSAAAQLSLASPGDNLGLTTGTLTGTTAVLGSPDLSAANVFEQVTAATGAGAALTYRIALVGFLAAFP